MAKVKKGVGVNTTPSISPEMLKLIESMNKKFGDNAVRVGIAKDRQKREYISTGILQLDADLNGEFQLGALQKLAGKIIQAKVH